MTPVKATTAVLQTLTCNVGDVTTAVTVAWKYNDNVDPITSGEGGYTIHQGTVDSETNIQKSTLEITADTLAGLNVDTATFKCAASSIEYAGSAQSGYKEIVVNFLTFGKFVKIKVYDV